MLIYLWKYLLNAAKAVRRILIMMSSFAGAVYEPDPIALYSIATTLGRNSAKTENVMIDDTLGNNTEVTIDYSHFQGVDISLRTPSHRVYNIQSTECKSDSNKRIISCTFPQNSEVCYTYLENDDNHGRTHIFQFRKAKDEETGGSMIVVY